MSYHRYNYSSPHGAHSYQSPSYSSPSGNSRYSSTSTYDSLRSTTVGGGLSSSKYGLGSGYGGSLGNLSSPRYGDYSSSLYGGSSYTPSSSSYGRASKYDSKYDSVASYSPRTDYSRYSKPISSYGSSSSHKPSSSDRKAARPERKTRFADEDYGNSKSARKGAEPGSVRSSRFDDSVASKPRQRRREKDV